jgi:ribose 5-phosphate isomerase B
MRIALASDHAGFELKEAAKNWLDAELIDEGTHSTDSVDYPDYAAKVARDIQEKKADYGVLVCGTGIGMSIAANRFKGVRAALCRSIEDARLAREHNDANVLVLGGRVTGMVEAKKIVETFFSTEFSGAERHCRRVKKFGG